MELEGGLAAGGEHALVLDDPDLGPGARLELELAREAGLGGYSVLFGTSRQSYVHNLV